MKTRKNAPKTARQLEPSFAAGMPARLVAAIEAARVRLDWESMETRKSDSLDFHEVSVWTMREVLIAAYAAGYAAGR